MNALLLAMQVVGSCRRSARSAFTLPELLITLAISALIMGGLMTTYVMSLRGFRAIENYGEIHSDGRYAIDLFSRDMRSAYNITSFGASNLVVKIPTAFNNNGSVTADKTITYSVSNGKLYRLDSSTAITSQLADNIHTLRFSLFDRVGSNTTVLSTAKGVQLQMNLRKTVHGRIQSEDFLSARLTMRNKK